MADKSEAPARTPSVLWISSHVCDGRVGNSIAVFALQRLGLDVVAVPTVLLPTVPGPNAPPGSPVPDEIFRLMLEGLKTAGTLARVEAVHAGYLRTAGQVNAVLDTFKAARAANPDVLISLDPILGDNGKLYIPEETAQAVRQHLVPQADILFPNTFELGYLLGAAVRADLTMQTDADEIHDIAERARALGPHQILWTSGPAVERGQTGILFIDKDIVQCARTRKFAYAPHGTGDLASALYLGRTLLGETPDLALTKTVCTLAGLIKATQGTQDDRLPVVEQQDLLSNPDTEHGWL